MNKKTLLKFCKEPIINDWLYTELNQFDLSLKYDIPVKLIVSMLEAEGMFRNKCDLEQYKKQIEKQKKSLPRSKRQSKKTKQKKYQDDYSEAELTFLKHVTEIQKLEEDGVDCRDIAEKFNIRPSDFFQIHKAYYDGLYAPTTKFFNDVLFEKYSKNRRNLDGNKVYILEFSDGSYYVGSTHQSMSQRMAKTGKGGRVSYNSDVRERIESGLLSNVWVHFVPAYEDKLIIERNMITYFFDTYGSKCLNKMTSCHPVRAVKVDNTWSHDFATISDAVKYVNSCGHEGDIRSHIREALRKPGEVMRYGFYWYNV